MKARILFLVVIFLLPSPIMAQNPDYLSEQFPYHFQKNNLCITNNFSMNDDEKALYLIRITGVDKEGNINFYGLSLCWFHQNPNANFSGLALSVNLGTQEMEGNNISVNGINISLFHTRTRGTINGISISGIGNYSGVLNGLQVGIIGTGAEYLYGLTIEGCMSQSIEINGIQLSLIINLCKTLNGIGISFINAQSFESYDKEKRKSSGLVLGVFNIEDISGLSMAAVNSGSSWLQIGLVNVGDSVIQIGLVNLDENRRMAIPIININF